MRTHALVVESRKETIEELEDRLLSINHTCEIATSQVQARQCLQRHGREYSYVILSLDVPVRPDRPPKIKFGFNLFREIQERFSSSPIPIVITLNYRNVNSSTAVKMVNDGAIVAVKPFDDDVGFTLEDAIFAALESKACPARTLESEPAIAIDQFDEDVTVEDTDPDFTESELPEQNGKPDKPEMIFYNNRVELCGVAVCGDSSTLTRRLLDLLKERTSEGKYRAYSGYELAVITDCESGQQGISATISNFRNKSFDLLKDQDIDLDEIVVNDRTHGYHLEDCIEVIEKSSVKGKPETEYSTQANLSEDQQKIMNYLLANKKASRAELEDQLQLSRPAINRQLQSLRNDGYIRCVGKGKSTLWLLAET